MKFVENVLTLGLQDELFWVNGTLGDIKGLGHEEVLLFETVVE